MMEVITNPFYENFMELCSMAKANINLCAPYIKSNVISDIFSNIRTDISVNMITKVNLRDFHNKASDLDSLKLTVFHGGHVYNCSNLHAKLYIFDASLCFITSANLTQSGLSRNAEYGILTDNKDVVSSSINFYDNIITRDDVGKISEQNIDEISDLLSHIPPVQPIKYPDLDITVSSDENLSAIVSRLTGWKHDVFIALNQFEEVFTSTEVRIIADQLHNKYPENNYREAKIRQILQQLRDLGLIEFSSPGVYKRLWI